MLKRMLPLFVFSLLLMSCGGGKSTSDENLNKKDSAKEVSLKELGEWDIMNYVDEFKEETSEKYLSIKGKGSFSNSATTRSDLVSEIVVDTTGVVINLYEYGLNHKASLEDYVTFKIKDSDNNIYNVKTLRGYVVPKKYDVLNYDSIMRAILSRGGELKFSASVSNYGNESSYYFNINADHFQDAYNQMLNKY